MCDIKAIECVYKFTTGKDIKNKRDCCVSCLEDNDLSTYTKNGVDFDLCCVHYRQAKELLGEQDEIDWSKI